MQPLTAYTPFRSGHARAVAVVLLLAASAAVSSLAALSSLAQIATGAASRLSSEDVTAFDFVDFGLGLIYIFVFVTTVVLFCMWLHRAYRNLPALGNPKPALKHSPGWAVGSFFVPVMNLFVPFRAVRETWAKSDPAVPGDNYVAPQEPPAPLIMNLWWAFWLISNFVNNAAFRVRYRAATEQAMVVAAWLDLFGGLLTIPAAVFAVPLVRGVYPRGGGGG